MKRLGFIWNIISENKLAFIIILCAAFLRLYRIPEFAMFLADQGRDAIIIKRIVTLEHLPAIGPPSSIGQVYLGPFYYYLMAPFLALSLLHPVGLAYGVVVISIIGLIAAYVFIKNELNETVAVTFLILASFSFNLIDFNRFSWNPNPLPFFSFLTLFFLYKTLTAKTLRYPFLFGAFFAFSFQLHHLAAFLAVPIGIVFLYKLITDRKKIKTLRSIAVSLSGFILISSPLILFDLKHDFLNIRNLDSLFNRQNLMAGGSPMTRLLDANQAFWNIVLQLPIDPLIALYISTGIAGILAILAFRRKLPALIAINALNAFSFIYLFSLLESRRFPHYYGVMYLSMFFVIAYLITLVPKKIEYSAILTIVIALYVGLNANRYYFISDSPGNQMQHAKRVADWIAPHIRGTTYNFATYPIEFTSEDTYVYFLEVMGYRVADRQAHEITEQLFVVCNIDPCDISNTGSWNITMFGPAKIDKIWKVEGLTVFQLSHR